MTEDPLSEVLDALHAAAALIICFDLTAPWAIEKRDIVGMPYRIVQEGRCWLQLEGAAPVLMEAGDIVMLPQGDRHTLSSAVGLTPVTLGSLLPETDFVESAGPTPDQTGKGAHRIEFGGGGELCRMVAGVMALRRMDRVMFLRDLPRLILIKASDQPIMPGLAGNLQWLVDEVRGQRPGWGVTLRRLTEVVCLQALRAYFAEQAQASGWLNGMRDPKIARALMLMHVNPCQGWTVEALAHEVSMSRARFAARFAELMGVAPMTYLSGLRLGAAAEQLVQGQSIAAVSRDAGYATEKSFARAFTHWSGMAPSTYRRRKATAG